MIYEYKDTFSLRDEIRTCPSIEIDIDVTDRMPFFMRPYHVREEDKRILHKEMKILFKDIKRRFFSLFKSSDVN